MKPPLRLVLDTNAVLSALLWEGRPAELLDLGASVWFKLHPQLKLGIASKSDAVVNKKRISPLRGSNQPDN